MRSPHLTLGWQVDHGFSDQADTPPSRQPTTASPSGSARKPSNDRSVRKKKASGKSGRSPSKSSTKRTKGARDADNGGGGKGKGGDYSGTSSPGRRVARDSPGKSGGKRRLGSTGTMDAFATSSSAFGSNKPPLAPSAGFRGSWQPPGAGGLPPKGAGSDMGALSGAPSLGTFASGAKTKVSVSGWSSDSGTDTGPMMGGMSSRARGLAPSVELLQQANQRMLHESEDDGDDQQRLLNALHGDSWMSDAFGEDEDDDR